MAFDFSGKKILVTGAGRGIGRGIAMALAKAGACVFALNRTQATLDTLVAEHRSIVPITLDLSDWECSRKELEKLDVMDGLVNNAGIADASVPCLETTKEFLDKHIEVNLMSVINCCQVIGKKMVTERRVGSIVNMSSVGSLKGSAGLMAYCVSKAGVDMVTKGFALELGPHNIRVNSVNPTIVLTDMVQKLIDDGMQIAETCRRLSPMNRYAEVNEVADLVLFLLSNHSTMVTGTTQAIDGGLHSSILINK